MSRQDKGKTLARLKKILKRLEDMYPFIVRGLVQGMNIRALDTASPDFKKWQRDATVAISHAFGDTSDQIIGFKKLLFMPDYSSEDLINAEVMLKSMIDEVEEYWVDTPPTQSTRKTTSGRRVFLIHGHDEAAKSVVARFLERLDLKAVILAEQASGGQTIIEKVEAHADVGYAVALLTADDVGSRQGENSIQPRARQNVIFELGYFIGRLGRTRVCALTKGQPEIPSDYSGVVYIPMESGGWEKDLLKELKNAGFELDANKVFG